MTISTLPRPDVAPARPWFFPKPERSALANGLTVVAFHLPGKHVAALRLLLDLPIHQEPAGQEGVAMLAASALDEGTEEYDAQGFAAARNRLGASYQVSCDATGGVVSLDVPVSRLGAALELLAEATLRPTFPAAEVDRLVKQRIDEITSEKASPNGRTAIEVAKRYYKAGSRRAISNGGTAESVASLGRDQVEAFYRAHVDPATSTLVVAGDLTGVDLEALVAGCFGQWQSQGRIRTAPDVDDVAGRQQVVVVDRPGAVQTQLALVLPGVARSHPDFAALQVACRTLGGGLDSRIMTLLREEKGYTYGISASPVPERYDARIQIGGAVQTEVTAPAIADLLQILRTFAEDGITEAELTAAVDNLGGRAPLNYERAQGVAHAAAMIEANGLPADYVDGSLAALRALTVAGVNEAYRRNALLEQAVLVATGDAAVFAEALGEHGDVTVVPA